MGEADSLLRGIPKKVPESAALSYAAFPVESFSQTDFEPNPDMVKENFGVHRYLRFLSKLEIHIGGRTTEEDQFPYTISFLAENAVFGFYRRLRGQEPHLKPAVQLGLDRFRSREEAELAEAEDNTGQND